MNYKVCLFEKIGGVTQKFGDFDFETWELLIDWLEESEMLLRNKRFSFTITKRN